MRLKILTQSLKAQTNSNFHKTNKFFGSGKNDPKLGTRAANRKKDQKKESRSRREQKTVCKFRVGEEEQVKAMMTRLHAGRRRPSEIAHPTTIKPTCCCAENIPALKVNCRAQNCFSCAKAVHKKRD